MDPSRGRSERIADRGLRIADRGLRIADAVDASSRARIRLSPRSVTASRRGVAQLASREPFRRAAGRIVIDEPRKGSSSVARSSCCQLRLMEPGPRPSDARPRPVSDPSATRAVSVVISAASPETRAVASTVIGRDPATDRSRAATVSFVCTADEGPVT